MGPRRLSTVALFVFKVTDMVNVRAVNHPQYAITPLKDGPELAVHSVSWNATYLDRSLWYNVHNI